MNGVALRPALSLRLVHLAKRGLLGALLRQAPDGEARRIHEVPRHVLNPELLPLLATLEGGTHAYSAV